MTGWQGQGATLEDSPGNSLRQPLQRVDPVQPADRLGDLFLLGGELVRCQPVGAAHLLPRADDPRIGEIASPVQLVLERLFLESFGQFGICNLQPDV